MNVLFLLHQTLPSIGLKSEVAKQSFLVYLHKNPLPFAINDPEIS